MAARISKFRAAAYAYRFTKDVEALLPSHYKKHCEEFMTRDPTPVHWRPEPGKFKLHLKTGEKIPVQNVPIPLKFPAECNEGLWGGEGIVFGYRKKKPRKPRTVKAWMPYIMNRVLYSEILDKYMAIRVTPRTMDLIDEAFGFDHYILKTHEVDLNSHLGMKLKREMLLALVRKTMYPENADKQEQIYEKYKEYIIPEEEAEWIGLPLGEAVARAKAEHAARNPIRPLKEIFTQQLIDDLKEGKYEDKYEEESWLQKLNPFTTKPNEEKKPEEEKKS
ncbi:39S ribosomal protein L28, mitochondrial-like [Gigantopelta aegis]|uniref:39S ribosomal protein L28, mitochondrial-like n=1 Tax=Gigantopelta aegis TaxID=1735272 RepID=UPI001B887BA6|nr:39S ribosomal protein L28, mitochondrial-like [Gigantopelta aegis]